MGKWTVPYHGACEDFLRGLVGTQETGCIIWPYNKDRKGYGSANVGGKQRGAHNWMCRLAHGEPVSIWRHAAHSCDNPSCVNPNHLKWATHAENMADKERAGTVARGENNGRTPLTEQDVLAIREAPADLAALAKRYGITKDAISRIRSGRRWAHVGGRRTSKERSQSPTCRRGHKFTKENTWVSPDGYRRCRACDRLAVARRRARKTEGGLTHVR